MSLSEKLKKLRTDRDWSQEFVAGLMRVDRSTLSKYETGQHVPSYQTLLQLSDIYKVDKDYLVSELDDSLPKQDHRYILKENVDDQEMEMIYQLVRSSPELKKALLEMVHFDEKKKAQVAEIIHVLSKKR